MRSSFRRSLVVLVLVANVSATKWRDSAFAQFPDAHVIHHDYSSVSDYNAASHVICESCRSTDYRPAMQSRSAPHARASHPSGAAGRLIGSTGTHQAFGVIGGNPARTTLISSQSAPTTATWTSGHFHDGVLNIPASHRHFAETPTHSLPGPEFTTVYPSATGRYFPQLIVPAITSDEAVFQASPAAPSTSSSVLSADEMTAGEAAVVAKEPAVDAANEGGDRAEDIVSARKQSLPLLVWNMSNEQSSKEQSELLRSPLTMHGAVDIDRNGGLDLSGGSAEFRDSERVLRQLQKTQQFLLLLNITSTAKKTHKEQLIFSFSEDASHRNLTISHHAGRFVVRVDSGRKRKELELEPGRVRPRRLQQIVLSYSDERLKCFLDGKLTVEKEAVIDFSAWRDYPITVGSKLAKDRRWRGKLHSMILLDADRHELLSDYR